MKKIGGAGFLFLVLCAPFLTSCEILDGLGGDGPEYASLDATEWILVQLDGRDLIARTNITLDFEAGRAGGYAGCNWYGGTYAASLRGALSFADVAQTERLCLEPSGVVEQESRYLQVFLQVRGYGVDGDRLKLKDAAGETLLVYARREELPMDPRDLVGTHWLLQAWNGVPIPAGTRFTISFQDSTAGGFAGCRNFTATYEAEGDDLRFTSLSMTETTASCTSEQWEQEGHYTTSLSETRNYRLGENRLDLLTDGGETLVFLPVRVR